MIPGDMCEHTLLTIMLCYMSFKIQRLLLLILINTGSFLIGEATKLPDRLLHRLSNLSDSPTVKEWI